MTNLDFAGNLGHSIVESKDDRIYIEKGNRRKLSEVKTFDSGNHATLCEPLQCFFKGILLFWYLQF